MALRDYKRVGEYRLLGDDAAEATIAIVIRAVDEEDIEAILSDVKKDAAKMLRRGDEGIYEAQWCNGAARIAIERLK